MSATASSVAARATPRLFVDLAASTDEIREAQALRYRVFAQELGARLSGAADGLDVDDFDAHCHHLLVRDDRNGQVVGCTRLLTSEAAARRGGFYSETEFDLDPIKRLDGRLLEVGRTCIAPGYRQGSAIGVLWSGLAGFIRLQGFDHLFGCASIPLGENDVLASAIMNRLRRHAMAPEHLRVTPRLPLRAPTSAVEVLDAPLPGLLRAYLRLGARVCSEPCRDADFGVADVLVLLDIDALHPAYSRHFIDRVPGR
ncbi:MAG: GNAT family N-acetyltransferase [Sphingobacteriia bacterium]|nr:GNAT family N-acetyltransferase [Sphingobacteriia bacterium]NCC38887.1 GNAT family N-acetyltransferase [Gammaproteobacteria bacterium]